MRVIIDEIDGVFYTDIALEPHELAILSEGYTVPGQIVIRRRKCYINLHLMGEFDTCEVLEEEE